MWMIFDTQDEAQAYCDCEANELPRGPNDATRYWDIPRQLVDGRWVAMDKDGDGQDWQPDWQFPEPTQSPTSDN